MLDSGMIRGFVQSVLQRKFDRPKPSPTCHTEWWDLCCADYKQVAIAAPRRHAKSTAITFSYILAAVLFREHKFVIICSDTETQSTLFLGDIKQELIENEDLISLFGIKRFTKLSETDIIVEMDDGYKFRIMAKGAEQKLRGIKWDNLRPDLIVCHEVGTDIYTPETGWIKNQDHPTARRVKAHEAYKITFEDGTTETVSGDHRYYIEGEGWKFPWEMKQGDNVDENGNELIWNDILSAERQVSQNTPLNQKLKNWLRSGVRSIWISTMLVNANTTTPIKKSMIRLLRSMLERTPLGKLLIVPKGVQGNSVPYLIG